MSRSPSTCFAVRLLAPCFLMALLGCSAPPATPAPVPSERAAASSGAAPLSSAPPGGSSVPVASPSARIADGAPAFQVLTPGLIQTASSYPDSLTVETVPAPVAGQLFQGSIRWAVSFRSLADPTTPFMVLLCDGSCKPLIPAGPQPPAAAIANQTDDTVLAIGGVVKRSVAGGRSVEIRMMGMGLGGAMPIATWRSPEGLLEVAAVMDVPAHDYTTSKAARAYFDKHELARSMEAIASAVDRALWPAAYP